jgi:hypothetical protein
MRVIILNRQFPNYESLGENPKGGIPDRIKVFWRDFGSAYIPLDIRNARALLKPSTTDLFSLNLSDY